MAGLKYENIVIDEWTELHEGWANRFILQATQKLDKELEQMGTTAVQVSSVRLNGYGQLEAEETGTVMHNGVLRWHSDHYKPETQSDEAMAWRMLWIEMMKYNKKLKVGKKGTDESPLVRALGELRRLQAIDRTLEKRLRG